MLSQELLSYIRQNTQEGFSRADIEDALRKSGWSDADILTAFGTITHAEVTPMSSQMQTQVSKAPLSTNAEIAHIQEELRKVSGTDGAPPAMVEPGKTSLSINPIPEPDKHSTNIYMIAVGGGLVILITLVVLYFVFLH